MTFYRRVCSCGQECFSPLMYRMHRARTHKEILPPQVERETRHDLRELAREHRKKHKVS